MVDTLKSEGKVRSAAVEAAMREVPRHVFAMGSSLESAHADRPVHNKKAGGSVLSALSAPSAVALLLEQLDVRRGHRVLEIGAGTGYNAALLAHIVGPDGAVVTMDIYDDVVTHARENLARSGYERVHVVCADGFLGDPSHAPYDRIIATVGIWDIAPAWVQQLAPTGRIVAPMSFNGPQVSVALERNGRDFVNVSAYEGGYIRMKGESAEPIGIVELRPGVGLVTRKPIDPRLVDGLLAGPSTDEPTGVRINVDDIFHLGLWLAVHTTDGCAIYVNEGAPWRQRIPPLIRYEEIELQISLGLVDENAVVLLAPSIEVPAYRVRWNLPGRAAEASSAEPTFNLEIRSYGTNAALRTRLQELVSSWVARGRPHCEEMSVRVWPIEESRANDGAGDVRVLEKRWTRMAVSFGTGARRAS